MFFRDDQRVTRSQTRLIEEGIRKDLERDLEFAKNGPKAPMFTDEYGVRRELTVEDLSKLLKEQYQAAKRAPRQLMQ